MSSSARTTLATLGILLTFGGAAAIVLSYRDQQVCGSLLGQVTQRVSSHAQTVCTEYAAAFYGGIIASVTALVLVIVAAVPRPSSTGGSPRTPYPARAR
jgi:hypothetical protein